MQRTPGEAAQTIHLFTAMKIPKFLRYRTGPPRQPCPAVPRHERQPADHQRPVLHLEDAPQHLPDRMASDDEVLLAVAESRGNWPTIRRAHRAVMETGAFEKR